MSTLYVTETGVQVHKLGQRLLVKRGNEVLQDIPMIKVDRVVLMGKSVSITTPTLYALTQNKVGVYYLNSTGKFILRTEGAEHGHSKLRLFQARLTDDPVRTLEIARAIVHGKISNQRVLVRRHSEGATWAQSALNMMDRMSHKVESSQTIDELRGREGLAAKEYFRLMRRLLRPPSDGTSWGFERRSYYPSTDPINALLSFGYTLLLNDLVAACQMVGLDPDLGYFHSIDYNKPSMALDLVEEFRPIIVDSIVLSAINRPILKLSDFEIAHSEKDEIDVGSTLNSISSPSSRTISHNTKVPLYLKENARKLFIRLYETRVNEKIVYPKSGEQTTYRRIFELQAYSMGHVISGNSENYLPFLVR